MKTLILYSGQARTVKDVWANHFFWLHNQVPNPTVVCSVEDNANADDMLCLQRKGVPFIMEKHHQPTIGEPEPRCRWHAGYPTSSSPQAILKQLWALDRVWDYAQTVVNLDDFDIFVRVRPDLSFLRVEMPALPVFDCHTPRWSKWGGINDRFAVMGRKAAEAYFGCFRARDALWADYCPLHPETMMGYHLRKSKIPIYDNLRVEFTTIRPADTRHALSYQQNCDVTTVDVMDACGNSI